MKKIKVGNRLVGEGEPCFIVAEAGSNHDGKLSQARELVDVAVEAGADAVKFQIYSAETLYSKKTPKFSTSEKPPWELIKKIETPREWIPDLKEYCDKKGIIFFATPFDFNAVDELDPYVDLYKVASFEIVDLSLIEYIARKQKPTIISTGLANMEEIEDAYLTYTKTGNDKLVFLQCASVYPAPPEIMNLRSMKTIRDSFGVITGLSDHTLGIYISVAAVAMGAKVIEKHFTLSRKLKGPDHPFAIEPNELKEMVKEIRDVEKALGNGKKLGPSAQELENYKKARRSIHAKVNIPKGTRITNDMLIIKRPGYGIKPKFINIVIGREVRKNIEEDQWITWDVI
ncbi:MAG: N-acetylneuraminate synthase [Thermotoga sp.]|nr:MAG: N-acetylneuraminate synthase [Thermotoga sp.]